MPKAKTKRRRRRRVWTLNRQSNGMRPNRKRCECGGITGICGTADGANAWRKHMGTDRHMKWEAQRYGWDF